MTAIAVLVVQTRRMADPKQRARTWQLALARWYHRRGGDPNRATLFDLFYAYRLLLGREPDDAGWAVWARAIDHGMSRAALRDGFLYSAELCQARAGRRIPELVQLEEFKMFVDPDDFFIGGEIARTRVYEPEVAAALRQRLRPGAVFVDIGANIGYFSLLAAVRVERTGRVLSFEPNDENCALLRRSVQENGFENVDVYPCAVADRSQTLLLVAGGVNSNGQVIERSPGVDHPSLSRDVPAVALDECLAHVAKVDVVKIDIEGGEARAWKGMRGLVATHRPVIITEFSPALIENVSRETPAAYLEQLQAAGYDLAVLGASSPGVCTAAEVIRAQAASGRSHLNLLACPR